ncbi:MAG TPA: sugar phosphate nucleotidyltransferase [Vicinamibacteria bacterium]|nr:sugar phosphate nucleotidyltransferase [Vicinamibacteria bacterium]
MQAVILAAGRSTRTYPLTLNRPKPLIPIWGRPLLEHQLRQLPENVGEVLLVVGYRRHQIERHFGSSYEGRRLLYVEQTEQRGTAHALIAAKPFLTGPTVVLNGDDFYHRDDLETLTVGGRGLLVTRAKDPQNRAVVTIEDDRIVDIVEKPRNPPPDAWCSVGAYCVEHDDLALLEEVAPSVRGELELPDWVLLLASRERVHPCPIRNLWMPLTYAWDVLQTMNQLWNDPLGVERIGIERQERTLADVEIEGPVFIGDGVAVGRGVRLIGPSAIGEGTSIGEGAILDNVVTFEGVRIGAGSTITSSVLGARVRVGEGTKLPARPGTELSIDVNGKTVVPEIARLGSIVGDDRVIEPGRVVPAGRLI